MGEKRLPGVGIFQYLLHIKISLWDPGSGKGLGCSCSLLKLQENRWKLDILCVIVVKLLRLDTGRGQNLVSDTHFAKELCGFKTCGWASWRYGQIMKNKLLFLRPCWQSTGDLRAWFPGGASVGLNTRNLELNFCGAKLDLYQHGCLGLHCFYCIENGPCFWQV